MLYYLYDITKRTEMQPCFGSRMGRSRSPVAFPIGEPVCGGSGFTGLRFACRRGTGQYPKAKNIRKLLKTALLKQKRTGLLRIVRKSGAVPGPKSGVSRAAGSRGKAAPEEWKWDRPTRFRGTGRGGKSGYLSSGKPGRRRKPALRAVCLPGKY